MDGKKFHKNGSHVKMRKGNQTTIVSLHNKDCKPGTLDAVLKQAGLK